jgi:hypothetical protein
MSFKSRSKLDLALGFHTILFRVAQSYFKLYLRKVSKFLSFDKQLLGQVAAKIRGFP